VEVVEESEPERQPGDYEQARQYIEGAREPLVASNPAPNNLDEPPETDRQLSRTECRLARPYAEIIQVGDSSGIHYECTHDPSHTFPA
jgi:hypothetical protein